MDKIVAWFAATRGRKSAAHIFTTIPAALLGGTIGVFLWSYSREVCQHQYVLKGDASTSTVWNQGYNPLDWVKSGGWWTWGDVLFPTVFYAIIINLF